jgi:elongation factor 1-beta
MPEFKNLTSDAGLTELNNYLASRSYIDGYKPSGADVKVATGVTAIVDNTKYPHVARWIHHILSFSPEQRKTWGGAVAASPAAAAAKSPAKKPAAKEEEEEEEEDKPFSLSDDEDDEETEKLLAAKAAQAAANKKDDGKKKVVAKSTLVLDVKPLDDETDLKALEAKIRGITQDGLLWGACDHIPVAYGIKKIRILAVVEDEKVSTDGLQEEIESWDDMVQSTDIHAFNKI